MTVKNRPVIGTVHCEHCEGTRSVHQYENGRHKGKLYTRCPSCTEKGAKFISKTSEAEQRFLRSKAVFKPEFKDLKFSAPKPEPQTPNEPNEARGVERENEPQTTPNDPKPEPQTPTRKGAGVFLAFLGGLSLIAIGLKK